MGDREELEALRRMSELEARSRAAPAPSFGQRVMSAGVQGFGQGGPVGMAGGMAGELARPSEEALNKAAYRTGGWTTDQAARFLPPEAAAGVGLGANVLTQMAPGMAIGSPARAMSPAFRAGARSLMQSALKPTIADLESGNVAPAIETMLKEGINPTKGGMEKLQGRIRDLNTQVENSVAASPASVSVGNVGTRILDPYNKFRQQVNPQQDVEAIKNAYGQFMAHPDIAGRADIPVQLAHELKKGTYRALGGKSYGEVGTASTEAQKALARGLREEVAGAVPNIVEPLKREASLMNVQDIAQRRALLEANKNPMGLSLLAGNPLAGLGFLADRSALAKATAARMMYSGSDAIPLAASRLGMGAAMVPQGQP